MFSLVSRLGKPSSVSASLSLLHSAEERYLAFHPSSMAAAAIFMVTASFCSDAGLEAMQDYMRDLNIEVRVASILQAALSMRGQPVCLV